MNFSKFLAIVQPGLSISNHQKQTKFLIMVFLKWVHFHTVLCLSTNTTRSQFLIFYLKLCPKVMAYFDFGRLKKWGKIEPGYPLCEVKGN